MNTYEKEMKEALWLSKNIREITARLDITTADIMDALRKQGIDPTPSNIEKVAQHIRFLAGAWAKMALQDETDWKQWID